MICSLPSIRFCRLLICAAACLLLAAPANAQDGNAYAYLDGNDPYYVAGDFPALTTPQWVGEPGVDAVVVLAIDDMRGHEKWEAYLRPILERLKQIDGRAPVSIMTCSIDPADPHLQTWLQEGLSLEIHTVDHPCPLLGKSDFAAAKSTFDRCVDLLARVPGNRPVAFRTPCCDSLNTFSPRLLAEIFNRTTAEGRFLTIDSSVFNLFTPDDARLPRESVIDSAGRERFRKYLPADRAFVNTIENYPYPYVIGKLCWEFPCVVPSDWAAQHLQKPNNPVTVDDLKAALDATVARQGVFDLVFHPHGWIRNNQVIELIDHAVQKHGRKVKFLTFNEAQQRLDQHLLAGQPLRAAAGAGADNGVRLLDLNRDGFLDVVVGNDSKRLTRIWRPEAGEWTETDFPVQLVGSDDNTLDAHARFGLVGSPPKPTLLTISAAARGAWQWEADHWRPIKELALVPPVSDEAVLTARLGRDRGVRLRDVDGDGSCELIVGNEKQQAIFGWQAFAEPPGWGEHSHSLPQGTQIVDEAGRDAGLRFVNIDEDGRDDVLFSNDDRYSLHLYQSATTGWSLQAMGGSRPSDREIPPIVARGENQGAWFHSRHVWWQNETTDRLPDLVDRRAFVDLLRDAPPAPKSPEESLQCIQVRPGFAVELVAAEPLVQDPVAFDWSPDGRLWVAEMADYPLGVEGGGAGGRIRVLEDADRDGTYDRSTVFLEGVAFPNGIMCWRDGVLVTSAPEIFFAADRDGDGKADERRSLFVGFGEGNQQHRVNGLRYGLDHWVYCANGDSGGDIQSVATRVVQNIGGRDFRFAPDAGVLDPQTGQTQFLRERNDWGDWFGSNNSNPMYHFTQEDHYLRRNPYAPTGAVRVNVSEAPGASQVYPISRTLPRFNDLNAANRFTSASSAILYRDTLFGPEFAGNAFVSEPVHNLIHREIVTPTGATFSSRRPDDERQSEFLASSDNWFRPTMLRVGPDGALWIADMYRQVIEHPEYIPADVAGRLELRAGHDRGRIYRVFPTDKPPRAFPQLDPKKPAALAAALASDNGWTRDVAQRLLVQGEHRTVANELRRLAAQGNRGPLAALHALCTLDGLGVLDDATLLAALGSPHAGVRRHAVRLCDLRLDESDELAKGVEALADDADPQVIKQVAYSLGESSRPSSAKALSRLLIAHGNDDILRTAAVSSLNENNLAAVAQSIATSQQAPIELKEILLAQAVVWEDEAALTAIVDAAKAEDDRLRLLAAFFDALDRHGLSYAEFHEELPGPAQQVLDKFDATVQLASKIAIDDEAETAQRLLAVSVLGRSADERLDDDLTILDRLLAPQQSPALQGGVVERLGRIGDSRAAVTLIGAWERLGPSLRAAGLDALLTQPAWDDVLVAALKDGPLTPADFDAARRQRFLERHADNPEISALVAAAVDQNRQKVVDEYRVALSQVQGDAERGGIVFKDRCSSCHQLGNVGKAVGPDLAALTDRSRDALLTAIFDPSRAVEAKFASYTVQTAAGLVHNGMLASETGNGVTLTTAEGKSLELLRSEIELMTTSGKSLMPEGLEKDLAPQATADLLAHLNRSRPPRKAFAGNEPALVPPDKFRGEYWLLATNCEIFGETLVYEPTHQNLGYWGSGSDHAVWQVEAPREATFAVSIEYACPQDAGGNPFVLDVAGERFTGTVRGQGTWDVYQTHELGTIVLAAGRHEVVLRCDGPPKGYLFDLKAVRMTPRE